MPRRTWKTPGKVTNNHETLLTILSRACAEDASTSDEEAGNLKEIREHSRADLPMAEWITKITGHDVRIEELIEGDYEPGLGLYFRCEWCNPYEQVIGRTWETEITFGEGSELLTTSHGTTKRCGQRWTGPWKTTTD